MDYGEEGNGDADQQAENLYSNNHDLIGVEGIVRAQKNEIEKKKVWSILSKYHFSSNSE